MKDQQLTPHFKLAEFTKSSTATSRKIDNTPPEQVISNLKLLCKQVLEPLRVHFNCPIIIGSGYRSPALNKAVGGVKNSQHMTGEAADIHLPNNETGRKWFLWMMDNLKFDQLIMEKSTPTSTRYWIHVSFSRHRCRQQVIHNLVKNPKA